MSNVDFSANAKYAIFVDKMKSEIVDLIEYCFDSKSDPDVQWKLFREQLTHKKREQILRYLETDEC